MKNFFLLILLINAHVVSAHCVNDTASNEQNFTNCKALAEQGDAYAQYALASFYNSGQGVDFDPKEAVVWYKKSAKQNNGLAQYSLGVMHEFGEGGIEPNQQEADKWYKLAADNGNYFALNKLGLLVSQETKPQPSMISKPKITTTKIDKKQKEAGIVERFLDWVFRVEQIKQSDQ